MSASRIISASLPFFCQKLSKLVEIWRSSDKNNFAQFFETRCRLSLCQAFKRLFKVKSPIRTERQTDAIERITTPHSGMVKMYHWNNTRIWKLSTTFLKQTVTFWFTVRSASATFLLLQIWAHKRSVGLCVRTSLKVGVDHRLNASRFPRRDDVTPVESRVKATTRTPTAAEIMLRSGDWQLS